MTIKKATTSINAFIILATLITLGAFYSLTGTVKSLMEVQTQRNALLMLGEELRQSSKDLTNYVRMYAATGDAKFEVEYMGVLDRRSGKTPRLNSQKLHPGEKMVLLDLIQHYGITPAEMAHINEGNRLSNGLVPLEVEAMYAVKGLYKDKQGNFVVKGEANRPLAISLVFGEDYQRYAASIMAELDKFTVLLDQRTEKAVTVQQADVTVASVVTLCCLAMIFLAALWSAMYSHRCVTAPLSQTTDFAAKVSHGDLDSSITVNSQNEIGTLRSTLNQMVQNIRGRVEENERAIQQTARKESEARKAMAAAEKAESDARAKAQNMLATAERLDQVAHVVNGVLHSVSAQIAQSERGATEQAGRVSATATAVDQMNTTVLEVARSASAAAESSAHSKAKAAEGATVVKKAMGSIEAVRSHSLALKEDMAVLGRHAQDINQIMSVISDIADQTNLLALNAAIEAARAGEAGRGFAVVADEVRKLAEKTMASTGDVAKVIKSIQESADKSAEQVEVTARDIEHATGFAGQSEKVLTEIVHLAENSADQVRSIATASEQQSATSEEIARSINAVDVIASETAQAMREASQSIEDLARQADVLAELIVEMKKV